MVAIVFGLLTAAFFAGSTICNSRAARLVGSWPVVAWAMVVGMLLIIPFLLPLFSPGGMPSLDAPTIGWLALAGLGNIAGLGLAAYAFRVGKVGVVAPIIATEGAIAALLAAAFGERIAPLVILTLAVIVVGVILSGIAPDPAPLAHARPALAVVLALACAVCFGSSLFATGHVSQEMLPLGLLLLPPRLAGIVLLAAPLAITRRMTITRASAPYMIGMGITEVVGYICYTIAAKDDVAIASVLVSQFAPIATVIAFLAFKERLGRLQIVGLVVIITGVVSLSLVQALG